MTRYVNVPLPDSTYQRVKQWADLRQQGVAEAIADYLANTLPATRPFVIPPAEPDVQVEREKAAYLQLYPELREKYPGQFVAIHEGQLVDHDQEYEALFERIDDRYPDTFVWLAKVEEEPISTIVFRSPRFVEET